MIVKIDKLSHEMRGIAKIDNKVTFVDKVIPNEVVNISLNKRGANIKYNFSSISNNDNFYKINVYHLDNNTSSDVFNRIVAKENSSNYFDINSYVDNGIKDCYLNQSTKIVTLGDSDNRVNPNMFISEEDVTAIHSSTIGSINEEELFYLMSRGISYMSAIKIIIKGIILSNINPNIEYREKILQMKKEKRVHVLKNMV